MPHAARVPPSVVLLLLAAAPAAAQSRLAPPAPAPLPAPAAALVDSAWAAYERGDRGAAAARAERGLAALRPAPGERAARFALSVAAGRAHADLGDPHRALPHLERAVALAARRDAARGWAVAYVGKVRFALGDTAGARAALDDAARHAPTERLAAVLAADRRLFGFDSTTYARWRTVATPHLRLHVSPAAPILDLAAFAAVRESAAVRIAAALADTAAAARPKPIDLFVWDSEREAAEAGLPRVHFARPAVGLSHLTWDQTVGHEIAHLIAYRAVRPEVVAPLVTEGVAVWFDGSSDDRATEAAVALAGAGLRGADVRALWADWTRLPDGVAYPVAGAVVETLVRAGTRDQLRALLRTQTLDDARRIYGPALDGWLDGLERRLAAGVAALGGGARVAP
jgi:hypothetical protein